MKNQFSINLDSSGCYGKRFKCEVDLKSFAEDIFGVTKISEECRKNILCAKAVLLFFFIQYINSIFVENKTKRKKRTSNAYKPIN